MKSPHLIKEVAIDLNSLGIPLAFCVGFLVGDGAWFLGISLLILYVVIDNIAGRLWFSALERLK